MSDLIAAAREHTERSPVLTLFVHPENYQAIRVYRRWGFTWYRKTSWDEEKRVHYLGMALDL